MRGTTAPTNTTAALNSTAPSKTIVLPKPDGAQDTIYLCNFRVSVDGEWLCLKELQDLDIKEGGGDGTNSDGGGGNTNDGPKVGRVCQKTGTLTPYGTSTTTNRSASDKDANKCEQKMVERDWVNYYSRDPASIERSNLVNICKLVVKELLEQSLRYGRMLDSDHLPLQHFFIVLEHVLRHGLKPKKGLLGPKKELWDLMQSVEKYCPESSDITASVRDLPTVKTHIGRARAWLRLALMQKKLDHYLQSLIENRDEALLEYYEPHALMLSDEVIIVMGILVGLNVIDCNLCVKEEDLDSQQGVIDFSLYLRSSSRCSPEEDAQIVNETVGHMSTVLDQKNYIEELNRHLNATVTNLQAKVESLTTTNALMKEDLAIARNSLLVLQAENSAHRQATQNPTPAPIVDNSDKVFDRIDPEMAETLAEERKKRQEVERELMLQLSLKAETEMAMKLLEKDIHEKQDTIVSLRRQLEDIKAINLDMYKKLQECESQVKHKTELLSRLETQRESMTNAISQLEKKYVSESSSLTALKETSQTLSLQVVSCEKRAAQAEGDLRIEREWRAALQEKEIKHKEQINNLQMQIKKFVEDSRKHEKVTAELEKTKKDWDEAQKTLEELGVQLSTSKLQLSEIRDKADRAEATTSKVVLDASTWTPDKMQPNCKGCQRDFNVKRRKHHCRKCGDIFCASCSGNIVPLRQEDGQLTKPVRVCDGCWEKMLAEVKHL